MNRLAARLGLVSCVLAATVATAVTPAFADTSARVHSESDGYYFADAAGVHDLSLTVSASSSTIIFDADRSITPGEGCWRPDAADPTVVHCLEDDPFFPSRLELQGDGGADRIVLNLALVGPIDHSVLYGGDGDDLLTGGEGRDFFRGGAGADQMFGRGGSDHFSYSSGPDLMSGGNGVDAVDYNETSLTDGVRATADGIVGDDGPLGEGDTIGADVEDLFGTPYSDVLVGNLLPNRLQGCRGADRLYGGGGNDTLVASDFGGCGTRYGVQGADHLDGGAGLDTVDYSGHHARVWADLDNVLGDDGSAGEGDSIIDVENLIGTMYNDVLIGNAVSNSISGGEGDDLIIGNDGVNTLNGDDGDDTLHGGADSDVLHGGDGADDLFGGAGSDFCNLGLDGRIKYSCEW